MPVSPVSACGEAAAGNISRPIVAKAACGFFVTRTAMPGFTFGAMSAVQSTAAASSAAASAALRRPSM